MNLRIKNIYAKLKDANLDGLIVSLPANISYLTGCTGRDAYLLISKKENTYFTDSRYIEEAKQSLSRTFRLKKTNGSVFKQIAASCLNLKLKRVGFEERCLPFAEFKKIKQESRHKINLIPTHNLAEELREIKSPREVELIKQAVEITLSALKFIQNFISPGKKEVEIAAELERYIRYKGARASAFDIIVASGPNSSFPHHLTGERKLKKNEPVLIDIGVDYSGYKSDLTRVFFLGKITSLYRSVYDIVLEAQKRAISEIKPAVSIGKVDAAARQYISRKGYGSSFVHNLGHGIGLEVHEEPHICSKEKSGLEPGMVFTVEPAIYLPGKFGIRIEDMVLVTQKGVELL